MIFCSRFNKTVEVCLNNIWYWCNPVHNGSFWEFPVVRYSDGVNVNPVVPERMSNDTCDIPGGQLQFLPALFSEMMWEVRLLKMVVVCYNILTKKDSLWEKLRGIRKDFLLYLDYNKKRRK